MSQATRIDEQAIRRRAHERWLERGSPTGSSEQDWLDAERELLREAAQPGLDVRKEAVVAPSVRRRAPRSIVTHAVTGGHAARLLVALVPDATRDVGSAAWVAGGSRLGRR